ncbi:MAG: YsnF/AvaK domain-containing protein [Acidobacteriia bacterium]|nr:YsnF/AvaK domain-containing protein [Terriglobia bacterium]
MANSNTNTPPSQPAAAPSRRERVVPVIEEEIIVSRRPVKTGSVRVEKHVIREAKKINLQRTREVVEVHRVPRNRVVRSIPPVRKIGSTLIVPVVEEEIVLTKRLVLKEELHVVKRTVKEETEQTVPIDKEVVRITRLDKHGERVDPAAARETLLRARSDHAVPPRRQIQERS